MTAGSDRSKNREHVIDDFTWEVGQGDVDAHRQVVGVYDELELAGAQALREREQPAERHDRPLWIQVPQHRG
jgi:hypothetical protein